MQSRRGSVVVGAALLLGLASEIQAWSLPQPSKTFQKDIAKVCTTAATCAVLLTSGLPNANAANPTAFGLNVDIPATIELVKTAETRDAAAERVVFIAESIQNLLGPYISVELPTDYKGLAEKALSGGATVSVNGQEVGIKVIGSSQGKLQLEISNALLPGLPFVGLPQTPAIVGSAAGVVADAAPAVVEVVSSVPKTVDKINAEINNPFFNRPIGNLRIDVGSFHRGLTPLDLVGGGSLALGFAYGSSYAYYVYSNEQEAKEAEERKKKAAEKRAAAAVAKKVAKAKEEQASAVVEVEELEKPEVKMAEINAEKLSEAPVEKEGVTQEKPAGVKGILNRLTRN